MFSCSLRNVLGAMAAGVTIAAYPAAADPVADFYKGRTITVYVAVSSGAYDLYARHLARHLPRHIPGEPTVIVQGMPGAGGAKAANYVYAVAPKDGSALLVPLKPIAMAQVMGTAAVRYDASKFNWVGSMVDAPGVLTVWHTAPVKTLADVREHETLMASSGVGAETYIFPNVINHVLGTKFRVITGYSGMSNMLLAVESGEVHGVSTVYGSLKGLKPEWLRENKVRFIAQVAARRAAQLPDVPTVLELAENEEQREVLRFLTLSDNVGRSITAPPDIPADRLAALRAAFDATIKDPAYLKEAEERNIELNPTSGVDVQKDVNELIATPQRIIDLVKTALQAN
jgi:tripartite-type tricarboxylate transporter receptor subunit TctC